MHMLVYTTSLHYWVYTHYCDFW